MMVSVGLKDIRKRYKSTGFTLHVDDMELESHNINVIVGPNGSGKSTLLKIIALLDKPDKGRVLFNNSSGVFLENNGREGLRKKIGFLMQNPYLFDMDVFSNIALGLKMRRRSKNEIVSKVKNILATLKIGHLAPRRVKDLSRGEYQKVAIAQVLVLGPEVILMDEPAANIDAQSTLNIEDAVRDIQGRLNSIIIMTTHSLTQAYRMSPDIISMREGKIADFVHENVFFGQIKNAAGDLQSMCVSKGVEVVFSTEKRGKSFIAIDPENIIVSGDTIKTSARNTFSGKIIKMESLGPNIRLLIDAGTPIYSIITKQSFEEMDINLGRVVCVSFKVNSVKVI